MDTGEGEAAMRGMHAPLSRFEETALFKVAFGSAEALAPDHVRRLLQLDLITWNGWRWSLTAAGRQRYEAVVVGQRRH